MVRQHKKLKRLPRYGNGSGTGSGNANGNDILSRIIFI